MQMYVIILSGVANSVDPDQTAPKECKSYSHFFSKKFQHICVSLDVNFNESLTNDIVSFEQLGPCSPFRHSVVSNDSVYRVTATQAYLCLCFPHVLNDTFWHSMTLYIFTILWINPADDKWRVFFLFVPENSTHHNLFITLLLESIA